MLSGIDDIPKSIIHLFLLFLLGAGLFLVISANFTGIAVASYTIQSSLDTQPFTYVLPNYNVTYEIVKIPPHDSQAVNPYAYNIVVYGPPPFPIQIEFYQQNYDNITEKRSAVMPTNAISTSIGCISYPTQITMKQIDNAEYMSKPYVPEFTIEVKGRRVSLVIENQPFEPFMDDDWVVRFYYNVCLNGQELYRASDGYPSQSGSNYTIISYEIRENADSYLGAYLYEVGDTLRFQVEAMIGYVHRVYDPEASNMLAMYPWVFTGETSGWSESQTVTLESSATPTPNQPTEPEPTETEPTEPEPTEPEPTEPNEESHHMEQLAVILGVVATVISVAALGTGLLVYFKIRKH